MLWSVAFERLGVVVGDLYFVDPRPNPGQEGAEQGVRLELRMLERLPLRGSVYSAQPIEVAQPLWRVDLLESVAHPGTLDRAHHHPRFAGWEPGGRRFVPELTADPLGWLRSRLEDPQGILDDAGVEPGAVPAADLDDLRASAAEVLAAVAALLERVRRAGHGAGDAPSQARVGWL